MVVKVKKAGKTRLINIAESDATVGWRMMARNGGKKKIGAYEGEKRKVKESKRDKKKTLDLGRMDERQA